MSPIIVISGPTATGKTKLAISLAKRFNGYIINGDSRQVYKELEIGTAKPSEKEIHDSGIDHFLFGHVSINQEYNLFLYQQEVFKVLKENKDRIAFLVGGTGMYIDSVIFNYSLKETKILSKYRDMSLDILQSEVGENMSELNESDRQNRHRLIRFLERGKSTNHKGNELNHLYLVYSKEFTEIEKNIKNRIETMFKMGLEDENVIYKDSKSKALNTLGYREFIPYFDGKISLEQVKEDIYLHTRQYAKRQITWFKRNKNAKWISSEEDALLYCNSFLANILS